MGQYDNRRFHYTYTYTHTQKKKKVANLEVSTSHRAPLKKKKRTYDGEARPQNSNAEVWVEKEMFTTLHEVSR